MGGRQLAFMGGRQLPRRGQLRVVDTHNYLGLPLGVAWEQRPQSFDAEGHDFLGLSLESALPDRQSRFCFLLRDRQS
jgi:hypothetical protein